MDAEAATKEDRADESRPGASSGGWERPVINILGKVVALGPLDKHHAGVYLRWMNDFDTLRLAGFPPEPRTLEQQIDAIERWTRAEERSRFTIYETSTWRPIGFAGLNNVSIHHRSAEFGITIGEPDARGKGYGTEATRLVLDYAFTARGLHSVYLTTSAYNIAAQRAYRKAGFKDAGRVREGDFMGGKFWDLLYMDCLATEFTSPVLARIFTVPEETD